jgi:hypothetical protein
MTMTMTMTMTSVSSVSVVGVAAGYAHGQVRRGRWRSAIAHLASRISRGVSMRISSVAARPRRADPRRAAPQHGWCSRISLLCDFERLERHERLERTRARPPTQRFATVRAMVQRRCNAISAPVQCARVRPFAYTRSFELPACRHFSHPSNLRNAIHRVIPVRDILLIRRSLIYAIL